MQSLNQLFIIYLYILLYRRYYRLHNCYNSVEIKFITDVRPNILNVCQVAYVHCVGWGVKLYSLTQERPGGLLRQMLK